MCFVHCLVLVTLFPTRRDAGLILYVREQGCLRCASTNHHSAVFESHPVLLPDSSDAGSCTLYITPMYHYHLFIEVFGSMTMLPLTTPPVVLSPSSCLVNGNLYVVLAKVHLKINQCFHETIKGRSQLQGMRRPTRNKQAGSVGA